MLGWNEEKASFTTLPIQRFKGNDEIALVPETFLMQNIFLNVQPETHISGFPP